MKTPTLHLSQNQLALIIKITVTIGTIIAIYFQDLTIITNEALHDELTSYILATPFLFTYLIYRKRKILRAAIPFQTANPKKQTHTNEITGTLLCLIAFLLYWHGSYTFYPLEYHIISLPIFTAGLILIIFNTKTLKILAFPITFLLFLTPPPTEIAAIAGATIATLSSQISYNILKTLRLPVQQITQYGAPALIVTDPAGSPIKFVIGTASSGIYSLIGFTIFATFIAYIATGPIWKKATLFLTSLPIIYALNILRIILLVSIGHWQGVNVAWDLFHLFGGWFLIFLGSLILLTTAEKLWKIQISNPKTKPTPCPTCNQSQKKNQNFCQACGRLLKYMDIKLSKQDIIKISAILLCTTLIINLQVPVFALTEGPPEILIQSPKNEQTTTIQILPEIPNYVLRFVYRDKKFEEIAQRDRALVYAYIPTDKSRKTIWVSIEIGSTRATWHSWEASLITWPQLHGRPPRAIQLDLRDIQLQQNPPITARLFAFKQTNSNTSQVVLYWYENAIFKTGSNSQQKYVKISLIAFAKNPDNILQTEKILLPFGKAIANYWQPIKTWSKIALLISQNGIILTGVTITLLITFLTYQLIKNHTRKKTNLKIYNKLTIPEEKHILKAAHQTSQTDIPTTNAIASQYKKISGKNIKIQLLFQKLQDAENLGLIKRDIISQKDEPKVIWKSQLPIKKIP
jgi:exosortase